MNPGGDFGKKELSPALRNRFTEIWVPPLNDREDLLQIIGQSWKHKQLASCGPLILDFFDWFGGRVGDLAGMGLRDILVSIRLFCRVESDRVLGLGQLCQLHLWTWSAVRRGGIREWIARCYVVR
jgi:midasin (ATPase involved in ribosome maturation)